VPGVRITRISEELLLIALWIENPAPFKFSDSFREDYGVDAKYFLPPCINPKRYHAVDPQEYEPIWQFLCEYSPLTVDQLKQRKIVTEISRTDKTKRKDVLIKAFAQAHQQVPEALLIVSIDDGVPLSKDLRALVSELGVENDVIILGSIWEQLPLIYNVTDVFCTPSVMEGFGMSIQEAAATGKPGIASNLVPFACEYLLGKYTEAIQFSSDDPGQEYVLGEGGIVVPADNIEGFAAAMVHVLSDDELRAKMGQRAFDITIPYFTWNSLTQDLMDDLDLSPLHNDVEVRRE